MYVTKRNGQRENVHFDKITERIQKLIWSEGGRTRLSEIGSSHFWAWKHGLKTGMYYLRTKPSAEAIKITVECETCSS